MRIWRRLGALAIASVLVAATFLPIDRSAAARTTQRLAPSAPCANDGVTASARQTLRHAGLVIVFPDGRIETRCIAFAEDGLSGLELLRRSDLPLVTSGFGGLGGAVCRIDNVGCSDPGNCWCQCQGASCSYWTYYTMQSGAWRFQNIGPAQRQVRDGDIDGWVWGSGRTSPQGARPPCPTSTATEAPSATPTPAPAGTVARPNAVQPVATATRSALTATAMRPTATLAPADVVARATSAPAAPAPRSKTTGKGNDNVGHSPPAGLFAFGGVAAALLVVGGGVALRRRRHG